MKGGGSSCCVQSCQNSVGRRNKNVIFYSFPIGNSEQRQQWIKSIGRKNPDGSYWEPSPHSVICSEHFVGGKKSASPDSEGFLPTLFPPPRPTPPPIHRPPIVRNPVRSDDSSSKEIPVVDLDEDSRKGGPPMVRIESNTLGPKDPNAPLPPERPLRKSARVPQKRSNWIETIDDEDVDDPDYNFQAEINNTRSPMNNGASNRGGPGRKRAHHDYNDEDGATESDLVVAKMSLINSLISELTCTQCGDKNLSIKKSREDKRIVYGLKLHCRKCKVLKEVLSSTKVKVNLTAAERNLLERGRSTSQGSISQGNISQGNISQGNISQEKVHKCSQCDKIFNDATSLQVHQKTHAEEPKSYFDMGVEEEHEVSVETQELNSVIRPRVSATKASSVSISSKASTSSSSSTPRSSATPRSSSTARVKQEKSNLKEEPIDIVEEDIDDPLEMEGSESTSHDSYFMDSVVTEEPNET